MDQALTNPNPQDSFTWRAYPANERPLAASFGGLIILATAGAAAVSFGPWWGLTSLVVLFLALNRFYLPSRFTIDSIGVVARFPFREQRMAWKAVRRFLHDANGGFLSTRSVASRMDAFSGLHVLFGNHRGDVILAIQKHMGTKRKSTADSDASSVDPEMIQENRA